MTRRPERIPERYPLVQDPPFSLEGVRTFAFALPCERARLEALLGRTFGWAWPELSVEPIGRHVLLAFTDVARARSADPSQGHFSYREATFFVPVWGYRGGTPFAALHVPFIYPNEGLAVAAGREAYGLPKKPATLRIPGDDDFWGGSSPLTMRVLGTRQFDGGPWSEQALMTVTAEPQSLASRLADELLDGIDGAFGPLPGALGLIGHLFEQDLLQLKQVPDVAPDGPPPKSLYRAVTRVSAPLRSVSNVRLGDPGKVEVRIEELASEPIRDVLGLPDAVNPVLAASFEMDFGFEPGEVWLERPDGGGAPALEQAARGAATTQNRTRVLVLGGGLSALATAHALTDTEQRRAAYDVHILAQGHLLGGKGASWRNPARKDRIEEHGIHVIFGFYHNFLRMFRSVYGELARPDHVDPSTFDEAFIPNNDVVFHDGDESWRARFPRTPAGYGAGPKTLEDQLLAAGALVQSFVGGSFSDMFTGLVLPSLGNRVATEVLWFTLTLLKGVYADVVHGGHTWEDLDAQDFREWLQAHRLPGSPDLRDSAIMQVPYDGVFAYEGHDQSNPRLSAGVAARGLLKLVTDYERAVFFEMSTGMGEAVFAPMLEVLRARGVKVELFAKVEELHVAPGRATKVRYARQAEVAAGPAAYDPLIQAGPVRCFRHDLDRSQLVSPVPIAGKDPYSDAVTDKVADVELEVDTDFDWVVCALPSPVTGRVLRGAASDPVLSRIAHIPTVATLHLQTWLDDGLGMLGWPWGPAVLGGFRQPLNSFQENTRLLQVEGWSGPDAPRSLLYCSGPFGGGFSTDPTDPTQRSAAEAAARSEATAFVQNEYGHLLPAATSGGTFALDRLHAPWNTADPLDDQYIRHNIELSSRYVLMAPGGLADRPRPVPPGWSNLRFAGDWTQNGIDIPCMEGAVVSALKAAASILGEDLDILW